MSKFFEKLKRLAQGSNEKQSKNKDKTFTRYSPISMPDEQTKPIQETSKTKPAKYSEVRTKWEFIATGYWHDDKIDNFNEVVNTLLSRGNRKAYRNTKGRMRELVETYGKIYKYNPFYTSQVELVKENDNKYDPNAVSIHVLGKKIAYIKKEDTTIARKYIDEDKKFKARFKGGKYKALDDFDNQIKEYNGKYYLYIDVV